VEHAARVEHPMNPFPGVTTIKFAMWLFLASEVMFFSGLIAAYIALRIGSASWEVASEVLNVPLTGVNTFILICSSVTMVKAFAAIEVGDQRNLRRFLLFTALLGLVFVGIKAFEWWELSQHHIGPTSTTNLFGATYFTMTGFHALHVLAGVAAILFVVLRAMQGVYSRQNHDTVEVLGLYWHFVDIVWIFLFTIVYLI
jgi:heme/copper-type cytochrome/quinol oxidase subunit 3